MTTISKSALVSYTPAQMFALVDDIENTTESAYTAWPDRLYVIDVDGRVAFKSAPGPYGFHPDDVERTLRKLLN